MAERDTLSMGHWRSFCLKRDELPVSGRSKEIRDHQRTNRMDRSAQMVDGHAFAVSTAQPVGFEDQAASVAFCFKCRSASLACLSVEVAASAKGSQRSSSVLNDSFSCVTWPTWCNFQEIIRTHALSVSNQ